MSEIWLQEYIFLAFRLHKATETTYGSPFVEEYWGPPAWREQVETEPEMTAADLVRQAMTLADALSAQGFTPNRVAYLGKHLKAMEDLMSNQPLFQVTNHHGEACGIPPQIDEQTFPGVYRSYFENQNGEQAIFLYDYEQERGTLYMGDAGWEHPYDMVDGKVPGLMLNRPEQLWLSACWEASGALKAAREQIREDRRRKRQSM